MARTSPALRAATCVVAFVGVASIALDVSNDAHKETTTKVLMRAKENGFASVLSNGVVNLGVTSPLMRVKANQTGLAIQATSTPTAAPPTAAPTKAVAVADVAKTRTSTAPQAGAWVLSRLNAYCEMYARNTEVVKNLANVPLSECKINVLSDTDCGNQMYGDGILCRCVLVGKVCDLIDAAVGTDNEFCAVYEFQPSYSVAGSGVFCGSTEQYSSSTDSPAQCEAWCTSNANCRAYVTYEDNDTSCAKCLAYTANDCSLDNHQVTSCSGTITAYNKATSTPTAAPTKATSTPTAAPPTAAPTKACSSFDSEDNCNGGTTGCVWNGGTHTCVEAPTTLSLSRASRFQVSSVIGLCMLIAAR